MEVKSRTMVSAASPEAGTSSEAGSDSRSTRRARNKSATESKVTWLVSQSNYGKLAGVKSQRRRESSRYLPTSKRSKVVQNGRTDGRMGRGKHKLRWGTDYEARAGYHYPSHRDRSTLQQPRLLNTPRFLSLSLSSCLSQCWYTIRLPRAPIMPGWETANY